MIIDVNHYNSLKLKDRPNYIESLIEDGKSILDLIHGGLPSTSVRRCYKNYSIKTGYIEPNRFNENEKYVNGKLFKRVPLDKYKGCMVSADGEAFNIRNQKKYSISKDKDGYSVFSIRSNDGKRNIARLHRLVLYTWGLFPPKDMIDPTTDHINGNINDNRIENLRWLDRTENNKIKHPEFHKPPLTVKNVKEICSILSKGNTQDKDIAKRYGVTTTSILNIKKGISFKSITKDYKFKNFYKPKRIETVTQKEIFESYFKNPNIRPMMRTLKMAPQTVKLVIKNIFCWKEKEININTKTNPDLPGYTDWI